MLNVFVGVGDVVCCCWLYVLLLLLCVCVRCLCRLVVLLVFVRMFVAVCGWYCCLLVAVICDC